VSRARTLVEVVARALAELPEEVSVSETTRQDSELIELFTAPGDLGRMIGRRGRTAAAFRTLAAVAAEKEGCNVTVEFRDRSPDDRR
jgi:hypothetical protein|tara:strand:- start:513 stop:773 length:261 start_codon:yes stop_codon:yes gene_type:complete